MPRQDKTIETDGGDYTSASAFENAADTLHTTADPWRAFVGILDMGKSTPVGFTVPPVLGSELIFEASAAAKQDADPANLSVARVVVPSNQFGLFPKTTFVTYDGIRIEAPTAILGGGFTFGLQVEPAGRGFTLKNVFFHAKITSGTNRYVPIFCTTAAGTLDDFTVINTLLYVDLANTADHRGYQFLQNADGGSMRAKEISYNTLTKEVSGGQGLLLQTVGTPDCVIDEFHGNRVQGFDPSCYVLSGSPVLTASGFNVSEDGTAIGDNPIINATTLESFIDKEKDFRLLAGAPGAGVSTNRDGVPALTTDNQGLARPAGEPWDAGALQVAAAAVNLADERVRNRRFAPGYKPWLIHRQGAV